MKGETVDVLWNRILEYKKDKTTNCAFIITDDFFTSTQLAFAIQNIILCKYNFEIRFIRPYELQLHINF